MRHTGKIATWKAREGFGFIRPDDGTREIFVHRHEFRRGPREPAIGEPVSYKISLDAQARLKAVSVRFHDEGVFRLSMPGDRLLTTGFVMTYVASLAALVVTSRLPGYVPLAILPLSLVAYLAYRKDKQASERNRRRVPESALQFLALLGGWPGALIAQVSLRHKSSKTRFRAVFWIVVLLNIAFLGYAALH